MIISHCCPSSCKSPAAKKHGPMHYGKPQPCHAEGQSCGIVRATAAQRTRALGWHAYWGNGGRDAAWGAPWDRNVPGAEACGARLWRHCRRLATSRPSPAMARL
jgi:hypothetical protein